MQTRECRLCHRIGTVDFLVAGAEQWECGNDRACRRRAARRAPDNGLPPQRVQRRRIAGEPGMPPGSVYVGRPSRWGNPIDISDVGGQYPSLDDRQVATMVVRQFEVLVARGELAFPNWRFFGGPRGPVSWTYPPLDEIRRELAGRDLACWCPPGQPCHADVLLKVANAVDEASR